eukprot:1160994-Pelagomonas_calceolata.AAC.19
MRMVDQADVETDSSGVIVIPAEQVCAVAVYVAMLRGCTPHCNLSLDGASGGWCWARGGEEWEKENPASRSMADNTPGPHELCSWLSLT